MLAPGLQAGSQALHIQFRERFLHAAEIAQRALQNRAGPDVIALRLVMKRYRQLNQSLEMASEAAVAGGFAPEVFKDLMSVEEAAGIKQG